ncbi:glutamine synthetase/guanido kinase [Punctularia strigosozonata HHB-11173 SS5]|uniref:glutamine synthetase/guanido kinase n=1 Tax=Punctularia strigosozonata (strain HHB-11173) TaxID=741275 RepID=UPI0004417BF0|nr:glutamine synthetase/guanido kinase [Punctularia strigosozonata HHB-11173 SS5]EIN09194.1 glutamine synthetase/guanido kinase [Punctularia strigosozonata HHB-11173 SS5]
MSDTYGATYTPSTIGQHGTWTAPELWKPKERGFRFVRLVWVDYAGFTRYRVLPISYSDCILASPRPGVALATLALGLVTLALGLVFSTFPEGFGSNGENLFVPDTSTLRIASYTEPVPSAPASISFGTPELDSALCPRALLKRVCDQATAQGVTFLIGFEIQFALLSSTNPITPVNEADWCVSRGLASGSPELKTLTAIAIALRDTGIELQTFHSELLPGQMGFEVVTGPLTPLDSADALIATREVIANVAASHGLRATFAPRIYRDGPGSSSHAHISLHLTSPKPASGTPSLSDPERAFLASVIAHLPALTALTLPTPSSHDRIRDGDHTRVEPGSRGESQEHARCPSACAVCPPRGTSSSSAGRHGQPIPRARGDARRGPEGDQRRDAARGRAVRRRGAERAAMGRAGAEGDQGARAEQPMGSTEAFKRDGVVKEVLGEEIVSAYLTVHEALERAVQTEAGRLGGDGVRVMAENY